MAKIAWLALAFCGIADGRTLKGFLYSDELGNSSHPVGTFVLAVNGKPVSISYSEPFERVYKSKVCNDIGAEWTVDVIEEHGEDYANRVTCTGVFDSQVHRSFALVRDWIVSAAKGVSSGPTLSAVYRSSESFHKLQQEIDAKAMKYYFSTSQLQKCIGVVELTQHKTLLRTHCAIELRDAYVTFHFSVTRNRANGMWEISNIDFN